jgi:predicted TIM-barrel fold metal-dependent hydrolase
VARAVEDRDTAIPIVDAHQHFWDPGRNPYPWLSAEPPAPSRYGDPRPLRRPYLPADYRRDAAGHGVVATVHVEAEWDPRDPLGETRWLEALAAREGLPTVLVAQAWLDREDVAEVLAAQAACPLVRGVRHKPRAAAGPRQVAPGAPGSMSDPRWRAGFARLAAHGLSFDLQVPWWHLDEARDLARAFPEIPLVLDHAGLPPADREPEAMAAWRAAMGRLAEVPGVSVKLSGLGRPGHPWTVADTGPIVRDVIALFGVDRCLFASNFPVDGLVADLGTIWSGFAAITAGRPPAERRQLFHDNARRVYRLG